MRRMSNYRPNPLTFDGDVLCCPRCGSNNLHHKDVHILNREGDDYGRPGQRVSAYAKTIDTTTHDIVDTHGNHDHLNLSGRRGSIAITFWCEICGDGGDILLTLEHNKGCESIKMWSYAADAFTEEKVRDGKATPEEVTILAAKTLKGY